MIPRLWRDSYYGVDHLSTLTEPILNKIMIIIRIQISKQNIQIAVLQYILKNCNSDFGPHSIWKRFKPQIKILNKQYDPDTSSLACLGVSFEFKFVIK